MTPQLFTDQTYLRLAQGVAAAGTCLRGQYGALWLGPEGQPLASGYNDAPPGLPRCNDWADSPPADHLSISQVGCDIEDNHCVRTIHAEMNGIIAAARRGLILAGSTLYVSGRPCARCALAIVAVGACAVVWPEVQTYHNDDPDRVLRTFELGKVAVRVIA